MQLWNVIMSLYQRESSNRTNKCPAPRRTWPWGRFRISNRSHWLTSDCRTQKQSRPPSFSLVWEPLSFDSAWCRLGVAGSIASTLPSPLDVINARDDYFPKLCAPWLAFRLVKWRLCLFRATKRTRRSARFLKKYRQWTEGSESPSSLKQLPKRDPKWNQRNSKLPSRNNSDFALLEQLDQQWH